MQCSCKLVYVHGVALSNMFSVWREEDLSPPPWSGLGGFFPQLSAMLQLTVTPKNGGSSAGMGLSEACSSSALIFLFTLARSL